MKHISYRFLIAAAVVVAITMTTIISVNAGPPSPDPDDPINDCGVWPYLPYRSSSNIRGKGEISCVFAENRLRVVVQIRDCGTLQKGSPITKICYNTDYCSDIATMS